MTVTMRSRLGWAVATALGLAAGSTAGSLAVGAVARPLSPFLGGLVYVAAYGAVIGAIAAVVQLAAMPRGLWHWSVWLAANAVGFGVGYVLASLVGEMLGNAIDPQVNLVVGEGTIENLAGAVLGVATGLAQWSVLRRLGILPRLRWWLLATAIGLGLGYGSAEAVLELFEVTILKANLVPVFGAIVGLFLGVAQAIALRAPVRSGRRSSAA